MYFAYKRISVVDMTIKLCLSANSIINIYRKQQHPPTANYQCFSQHKTTPFSINIHYSGEIPSNFAQVLILSWGPNHHYYCTPGDCTWMHAVKK